MDKEFLNEIDEKDIDLTSFEIHGDLNPYVWIDEEMKSNVRVRLLEIARDFIKDLEVPWVKILDVTLTGSMANFNWSDYSDFDLHILIDFNDVNNNQELVTNYFLSKKNLWNDKHNIKLFGYDVEVYVQNINEPHTSTGVFSIKTGKWVTKPELVKPKLDSKLIKHKATSIINNIEHAIELFENKEFRKVNIIRDKIIDKLKSMREKGLARNGEFSYENLAFKVVRRSKYLDVLDKINTASYDLIKSMNENKIN